MSFLAKGANNLGLINAFSFQFSFLSFDLEQFLSLNFHDLDTFEDYRPVVLHNASQSEFILCYLMIWQKHCCVNFDCLVMVVSVRFLYSKITLFLFVVNNYFSGGYFETM